MFGGIYIVERIKREWKTRFRILGFIYIGKIREEVEIGNWEVSLDILDLG